MILVRRPTPERVEEYRQARLDSTPTAMPAAEPPPGFRHDTFKRTVGSGPANFTEARCGLERWAAHRGSGVEVFPPDEPTRFGFVYATLPDHPEQGYESFVVSNVDGEIVLQIDAVSRPGIPIVRLGAPVTRLLQRRASDAYLAALRSWVTAQDKHL